MNIVINGKSLKVPKKLRDISLLQFLRDCVALKCTKYGCGAGLCGACTVHVDGVATRSCLISVEEASAGAVTTIEGLAATAAPGTLHPVQKAWLDVGVPQCGYCQAGQIMTASALLKRNPAPSTEEIREGMSGNLCRCGTYGRIQKAVAQAALES
jgi:isoquinoline 1-oxidoreductase subunit alpha